MEICVTGLSGAKVAESTGADRIEVCAGLPLGGLTPGVGVVRSILAATDLPLIALIRPREGGFRYHADEITSQLAEIEALRSLEVPRDGGAPRSVAGFAVGVLTTTGDLDREALARLHACAPDREWCLHRAFDHVRDPMASLETAIDLGFDRILTSGQAPSAPEGIDRLAALVDRAAGRIEIMPGGGIHAENAVDLIARTEVSAVHLSGTGWAPESMTFRREGISLGAGAAPDEARHLETSEDRLAAFFRALNEPDSASTSPGNEE